MDNLIKKDSHQIFLLVCPASVPVNFANHSWFACNEKGVFSRFEVRRNRNKDKNLGHMYENDLPPFSGIEMLFFSKKYHWKGKLIGHTEGKIAEKMIKFLKTSKETYPYKNTYFLPGPNCNTYVQWVLDHFPEFKIKLPKRAIGKNYKKITDNDLQIIKIVPARISHAQAMHIIHTNAVNLTCKDYYTPKQITAWLKGRSPEGYHDGIKKGEMYVAQDRKKIVGFGHAIPGEITAIFVDPAFHKKGIGALLLKYGIKIASKNNKKIKIESTINAENFYKRHGFTKIKNSICIKHGEPMPTIILEYKKISKI